MSSELSKSTQAQRDRLTKFSADQCVDIHCHCLPGLDDGAQTMDDAVAICRALAADGITTVIATPHQLGAYEGMNSAAKVREAVATLRAALVAADVPLNVVPGADVRVDDQLLTKLDADEILTLADGHAYILLELPHDTLVELSRLIGELAGRGITAIISHPERHGKLCRKPEILATWIEEGAILQVTAASLTGVFGGQAEQVAWQLIEAGWVSLVASDAHDTVRRPPTMTAAIDLIAKRVSHAIARRICIENPIHVLNGSKIARPRIGTRRELSRGRSW